MKSAKRSKNLPASPLQLQCRQPVAETVTEAMRGFAPPPRLTISQWADEHRVLSPESSAEPGKWSTARVEYMRGVMDAVGDPGVSKIVCMKASQVAWTEVLNNACGYFIDQDPATILV